MISVWQTSYGKSVYSSLKGTSFREVRLISLCLSVLFDGAFAKSLLYELVQKAMPATSLS